MNTYAYIYKISNTINDKLYIGFTTKSIEERWEIHIHDSKYRNYHLHKAMKKYGIENFKIEVISMSPNVEYCKNVLEPYYIKKYNSFNRKFGYNMTLGGEGTIGYNHLEEAKEKMRIAKIGKPISKEHKENIGKAFAKNYKFLLNNEVIEIFNLRKYCRENDLDHRRMNAVFHEKQKFHKGYTKFPI